MNLNNCTLDNIRVHTSNSFCFFTSKQFCLLATSDQGVNGVYSEYVIDFYYTHFVDTAIGRFNCVVDYNYYIIGLLFLLGIVSTIFLFFFIRNTIRECNRSRNAKIKDTIIADLTRTNVCDNNRNEYPPDYKYIKIPSGSV